MRQTGAGLLQASGHKQLALNAICRDRAFLHILH
jgi:hypothetical protein